MPTSPSLFNCFHMRIVRLGRQIEDLGNLGTGHCPPVEARSSEACEKPDPASEMVALCEVHRKMISRPRLMKCPRVAQTRPE